MDSDIDLIGSPAGSDGHAHDAAFLELSAVDREFPVHANWGRDLDVATTLPVLSSAPLVQAALVDRNRFSRDCLTKVLESLHGRLNIFHHETIEDCVSAAPRDLDLIVYHAHADGVSDALAMQRVSSVGLAFPDVPFIVLSDAEDAQHLRTIRNTLKSGAHGLIPTRTTGISIAIAAIRLVKAGGTFAPIDPLRAGRPEQVSSPPGTKRLSRLTARQVAVLQHMQLGNANKVIAYQMNMSESTVKVHVRNIMRKVGATNRTQAVYLARCLYDNAGTPTNVAP